VKLVICNALAKDRKDYASGITSMLRYEEMSYGAENINFEAGGIFFWVDGW